MLGKQPCSLTQVDVFDDTAHTCNYRTTLTSKEEIEQSIMHRNRRHSLQSLQTPFMCNPHLSSAMNPGDSDKLDQLLKGSLLSNLMDDNELNETERSWIDSLKQVVNQEISLSLSVEDFKKI
jgi:hypothetical protein